MDLDAILRRRPEVALVDELAHTNVPGSGRHEKRWQDVLDILGAGISVITTVNIQHLESIAGEVEQMTGAKVRERLPDWVVRKADQIELVDSSPEQLRRRMLHGNIAGDTSPSRDGGSIDGLRALAADLGGLDAHRWAASGRENMLTRFPSGSRSTIDRFPHG
jgi:hypothetical protein